MIKIMIAEDDPVVRQLFKELLIKKGYEIVGEAADGQQAIQLFYSLSEKPDLIVLDYHMPNKNGLEVTKRILKSDPRINILMISGDPRITQETFSNIGIRFKKKPLRVEELLNEIKTICKVPIQST